MNDSKTLVVRDRREPVSREERVQLLSQCESQLLRLQAAPKVGIGKGMPFEFVHLMSPNWCFPQAA
jgi:hypothetical protein